MIWTILIQAMVSLLVFFFEQWWKKHHPTAPDESARKAFLMHVNSKLRFKLVPKAKREQAANYVFDRFAKNYAANPPKVLLSDAPLTEDEAKGFAAQYARGIE